MESISTIKIIHIVYVLKLKMSVLHIKKSILFLYYILCFSLFCVYRIVLFFARILLFVFFKVPQIPIGESFGTRPLMSFLFCHAQVSSLLLGGEGK